MEKNHPKIGKLIIGSAAFCLVLVVIISGVTIFNDTSSETAQQSGVLIAATPDFDHKGSAALERYNNMPEAYISGSSSERTLNEYYSRRQYPGSPPFIPHPVKGEFGADEECAACHNAGGFVKKWNRHAPVTPHPEFLMCQQCHVVSTTDQEFVESGWESVLKPRLGQSHLPGSPPPFPHALQMREDCVACHAGPGAVTEVKMRHEPRGVCRQCHVPVTNVKPFSRDF
jgi:nitrate reductase (cytochrome), electron transfer subunit